MHRSFSLGPFAHACACLLGLTTIAAAQRIEPGTWDPSDVLDGWVVHQSRHYQIQSQCGIEKAERLANHMEAMLHVYIDRFRPARSEFKRYPVKLFESRGAFRAYGGIPGAAAYYDRANREMVCYDTGKWMDEESELSEAELLMMSPEEFEKSVKMDLLGVAAHEGWHQYFHWYVGSMISLPPWINEGMGDYFYCARPLGVEGRKPKVEYGRLFPGRLQVVRKAVADGTYVPLEELLKYSQRDYYSNPSVCYSQGWALCHFLLHSEERKYQKIVPWFIKEARDSSLMHRIHDKVFKRVDLDELEEKWKAWVLEQKLPYEKAHEGLTPEEVIEKLRRLKPTTGNGDGDETERKKEGSGSRSRG